MFKIMLEGKNIILRPLRMTDWEKTLEWRNDLSIKRLTMMHPFPITEMVERDWYEKIIKSTNDKAIYFTITKKEDIPIGFVSLSRINYQSKTCWLSIVIGETEEQSKGYGKEAMELIIGYAFNQLNMNKISLEVTENNTRAISLYMKLGFNEEGLLKQHFYSEGGYQNVHIFSIFRSS